MREILFRGKTLDDGKWVYGAYSQYNFSEEKDTGIIEIPCIIDYDDDCLWCEIVPESVGQYTGLTDKNGKKIFEGDIVDCWSEGVNAKGTVQQRKDGLWIIYPAWQKYITWGLCPNEFGNTDVEVIGNIHDNPELLEAE